MKNLTLLPLIAILCSGCATTTAITPEAQKGLYENYTSIRILSEDPPHFNAETAMSVGLSGGAIAGSIAGRNSAKMRSVKDPSLYGEEILTKNIANSLRLPISSEKLSGRKFKKDEIEEDLSGVLLVDVKTTAWGYSYYPLNWTKFSLNYSGRTRLIDGNSGNLIADYICARLESHEKPENAYKHKELNSDNLDRIDADFEKLVTRCVDEFYENTGVNIKTPS